MNAELEKFVSFPVDFDVRSVSDNWSLFKLKMQELADTFVLTVTFSKSLSAPWFKCSLKRLNSKKKTVSEGQDLRGATWENLEPREKKYFLPGALLPNIYATELVPRTSWVQILSSSHRGTI